MGPTRSHRRPLVAVVALAALLASGAFATGRAEGRARRSVADDSVAAIVREPLASYRRFRLAALASAASRAPANPRRDRRAGFLLVHVERDLPITVRPGGGRVVGIMPAASRYYRVPTVAWVRRTSPDGAFGLVDVPYVAGRASGWIPLRELDRTWTRIRVVADLSRHRMWVRRGDTVVLRAPAATGADSSPTPPGRYFVTDRVAFPAGGPLGTYAFGISGVQPRLPAGWSGGDQLAIHGTDAPWSVGRSASAGCLRVLERVLDRLRPLLRLGTPVIVRP